MVLYFIVLFYILLFPVSISGNVDFEGTSVEGRE